MLAVFDLGRTHKKFLLFDRDYKVVDEITTVIPDIRDEDGDACEDINAIADWMKIQLQVALENKDNDIRAINFSAHGASLVHIDRKGEPVTPLYDYMKPLNNEITDDFYNLFGGKQKFSVATSSPALNMLNSGIQLYWLRKAKSDYFKDIDTSLHLPQYANYLFSRQKHADITSIGCHTGLWNFEKRQYHSWVQEEKLDYLLPNAEAVNNFDVVRLGNKEIFVGIGLHDSSAALLPFVKISPEPFVLLSSGTWNITLNPFFEGILSKEEYQEDCLYFLLDKDQKVAASRLFLGNEFDYQVKKLEVFFQKQNGYFQTVQPDINLFESALNNEAESSIFYPETMSGTGPFPDIKPKQIDLSQFSSFEAAYHRLMLDLTYLQKVSIELICGEIKRLYVSGGFLKNTIFMELLQAFLPDWKIFIAENKRASPLGAAVAIHETWQHRLLPQSVSPVILFAKQLDLNLTRYKKPDFKSLNH